MVNIGDLLSGRYEIESKIGQGGMSTVYRASDTKLGRNVAIKVLKEEFSSDEEFVEKFKNEAQSVASLIHPNIVAAYDAIDEGELHYIIMELVEGVSLKDYIQKKGVLSNEETIDIALKTAEGISCAHKAGIIHRDIKPQNIIVTSDGTVKVADFGIAKAVTGETISTAVLGSAHYISPEQAKSGTADARSDIYSLGITMYEMITGKYPFDGDNTVSVVMAHINTAMVPPIVHNKEMYPALSDIILRCTRKNPRERYQNADELVQDLKRCLEEPEGHFVRMFETVEKPVVSHKKPEHSAHEEKGRIDKQSPFINRKVIYALILLAACAIVIVLMSHYAQKKEVPEEPVTEAVTETESVTDIDIVIKAEHEAPELIGLSVDEAKAILNDEKALLIVDREEYNDVYLAGRVIWQSPEAGEGIREGDSVYVAVSLGSKLDSVINSLKGITVEEASERLGNVGVEVSGLVKQFSEDVSDGLVVGYILDETVSAEDKNENTAENPTGGQSEAVTGEKVTEGSKVKLIVSAGPEAEGAVIPQITGLSYQEAASVLEKNNLSLGSVSMVPEGEVRDNLVTWQSVAQGELVKRGTGVSIQLNSDPEAGPVQDPQGEPYTEDENEELSPDFYYASIDESYQLGETLGPSVEGATVNISMRLVQHVNDGYEYSVLVESRPYAAGTRIPVSFRNIRGVSGVDKGTIEVYDSDTDMILTAYEVYFHPLGE